jgi:hypothetical protein
MPFDGTGPPHTSAEPQQRDGLNMDELILAIRGEGLDLDRPTVVALMADAGHLVRLPTQRRYLLSPDAERWGLGRNVQPKRGFPFPVIYHEHVPMVARSLGWSWIMQRAASFVDTRSRREFLARHYSHLPVETLVRLSGSKKRTVELDLARLRKTAAQRIADLRI